MRLQPRQIAGFLKAPDAAVRCILVYGTDATMVSERVKQLHKTFGVEPADPFQTDNFTADQIAADPALLSDAAAAQSLMGGRRIVRITEAGDRLSAAVKGFLADLPGEAMVLIEGKDLKRTGSLVKAIEGADAAAAVPCYEDSARDREALFSSMISEAGLRIDNDALDWLSDNLDAGRGVIRSEMEKLVLSADSSGRIDLNLVQSVVSGEGDAAADALIQLACSGETAALGPQLERARDQDLNEIAVVRALISHFMRLLDVQLSLSKGDTLETAIGKLRPKVFFKVADAFKRQVRLWPRAAIAGQLARLEDLEADLKSSGNVGWVLCERHLYQIAAIAARARQR